MRKFFLTGLGSGYLPIAPGTWGSAVAVVIWIAAATGLASADWGAWPIAGVTAVAIVLASAICVAFGNHAIACWHARDPRYVVIDEFAGQWVALLPAAFVPPDRPRIIAATIAFLLFRALDVVKPPPARQAESLPAGTGILADDLLAGAYAAIGTWLATLCIG